MPPLEEYRRKRDFARTPEPVGEAAVAAPAGTRDAGVLPPHRFVVQRHRATRLHYDLRLEVGGVLVSWAVPRGPSLDPTARRMAIRVEDHPLEYVDFEGVIPARQYGAGDVIVWDWGTWVPEAQTPDPAAALAAGELKLVLQGEKLRGRFTLVRTTPRPGPVPGGADLSDAADPSPPAGGPEQWLLIHKRDGHAVEGWDAEDHPLSVRSGRTNDEVRAAVPAIWVSRAPAATARIDLSEAVEAPLPHFVAPMQATLVHDAFDDDDWVFEVKWDGYRVEAVVAEGQVRTFTRAGRDAGEYFPGLLDPPTWIDAREAVVDGEVVALDDRGRPDFSLLQERVTSARAGHPVGLVYQAFDLLHLDGRSLLEVPLEDRQRLLQLVLREHPRVRFAGQVPGQGRAFLAAAVEQGLEGVVAKHRRSRYEPGRRTRTWLKVKIRPEQELVVGGWTPTRGTATAGTAADLGALAVGVHEGGVLRYAGKVGSGFDARSRRALLDILAPLAVADCPFEPEPARDARGRWGGDLSGVTWVRPELVIRAELGGWSRDGIVRQAAYKGRDPGRDPASVVRERPVDGRTAQRAVDARLSTAPRALPAGELVGPAGGADTAGVAHPPPTDPGAATPLGWLVTPEERSALAQLPSEGTWVVAGQAVRLTNLDKVLLPARDDRPETTKRHLVEYFARMAPAMLRHLDGRPLNLHRFPNGVGRPGFWQKDIPGTAPGWLTTWREPAGPDREPNRHLVADRPASLAWLANQAAFEVHAWTSTCEQPTLPTFALIDIDPGPRTTWEQTLILARLYRTALDHLGVRGYPKTTGSRGLQVWIRVEQGRYDFAATSHWVERLSRAVAATVPDLVSWEWATRDRQGRARLDYTQNAPIKTLVAPYSVRPSPGAPVSMPIAWDELDDPKLRSDLWTVHDAPDRVARVGDLFAGVQDDVQVLPPL